MIALDLDDAAVAREQEAPPREQIDLPYTRPTISRAGSFKDVTRGSGSSLAFDFYLTDYP
jgi:hypothetical protein